MQEVEDYLKFVGRLHDVAGVDPRFLDITGLAFCHALDVLDQKGFHGDIWNSQVKDTWQIFFRVVVRYMKRGYASPAQVSKQIVLFTEQKSLITEVSIFMYLFLRKHLRYRTLYVYFQNLMGKKNS